MDRDDFIIVYEGDFVNAGILRGLLEDAGIEAFLRDEYTGAIAPWTVAAGGAGAVKVVIRSEDLETARPILDQFANVTP